MKHLFRSKLFLLFLFYGAFSNICFSQILENNFLATFDVDGKLIEIDNLTWEPIEYCFNSQSKLCKNIETRFGAIEIIEEYSDFENSTDQVKVLVNKELLFEEFRHKRDFGFISIVSIYQMNQSDVVLLKATSGGSGSPPPLLLLIILSQNEEPRLIVEPSFRSVDGTQLIATNENQVFFDLGLSLGQKKYAIYVDGKLSIYLYDMPPVSLPDNDCERLYEITKSPVCIHNQGFPNVVLRYLNALNQRPGFDSKILDAYCTAAGSDNLQPYSEFKNEVCIVSD